MVYLFFINWDWQIVHLLCTAKIESQSLLDESLENEDKQDQHLIAVAAINAGASIQTPTKAAIPRKRKRQAKK